MANDFHDRTGADDPSEDPLLAFHWAVTATLFAVFVSGSLYTQSRLLQLQRQGLNLRMLGHPNQVSVLLAATLSLPLWPVIRLGANVDNFPCPLYIIGAQISAALTISVYQYRTFRFVYRWARLELCKRFIIPASQFITNLNEREQEEKYNKILKATIKFTRGKQAHICSIITFSICVCPLIFILPENVKKLGDAETNTCSAAGSFLTLLVWYLWAVPFMYFLKILEVHDPFQVIKKVMVHTISLTGVLVAIYSIQFAGEKSLGTSHQQLLIFDIFWIFMMSLWFTESYFPLAATLRNKSGTKNGAENTHSLMLTLANPDLLQMFEEHLISEWSIENLQFFKSSVLYKIRAEKILARIRSFYEHSLADYEREKNRTFNILAVDDLRALNKHPTQNWISLVLNKTQTYIDILERVAWRIYVAHIDKNSKATVNLPASISNPIHALFNSPRFETYSRHSVDTYAVIGLPAGMHSRMVSPAHSHTGSRAHSRRSSRGEDTFHMHHLNSGVVASGTTRSHRHADLKLEKSAKMEREKSEKLSPRNPKGLKSSSLVISTGNNQTCSSLRKRVQLAKRQLTKSMPVGVLDNPAENAQMSDTDGDSIIESSKRSNEATSGAPEAEPNSKKRRGSNEAPKLTAEETRSENDVGVPDRDSSLPPAQISEPKTDEVALDIKRAVTAADSKTNNIPELYIPLPVPKRLGQKLSAEIEAEHHLTGACSEDVRDHSCPSKKTVNCRSVAQKRLKANKLFCKIIASAMLGDQKEHTIRTIGTEKKRRSSDGTRQTSGAPMMQDISDEKSAKSDDSEPPRRSHRWTRPARNSVIATHRSNSNVFRQSVTQEYDSAISQSVAESYPNAPPEIRAKLIELTGLAKIFEAARERIYCLMESDTHHRFKMKPSVLMVLKANRLERI